MSTPFHDLDEYIALPRTSQLIMSPDGTRLAVAVQTLDEKKTAYRTAWWEVDPTGERPARRLTRGAQGEPEAVFTAAGDLLFTARRDDDAEAELFLLPRDGGEARVLARRHSGVGGPEVAAAAPVLVVASDVLPGARDDADDERLATERKDVGVQAVLHDGYPVRSWDHDLGPGASHLFAARLDTAGDEPVALRDLTPGVRHGLAGSGPTLARDGSVLVLGWSVRDAHAGSRSTLVAVEVATGTRRTLVDLPDADVVAPQLSPDGRLVAFVHEPHATPHRAPVQRLGLVPTAGGDVRLLAADWDRWPESLTWLPDGSGLLVVADDDGRAPVFRVGLDGTVSRLTPDDAAFRSVTVAPDGRWAYALRTSYAVPEHPVRIDLTGSGAVEPLPAPSAAPQLPGVLDELETTTPAGHRVRAWLARPAGVDPAPLLLWVHGGPLGSWNAWSWRWNPWLMVARGYAVLLPDPALSTGYGQDAVQRGWGAWGTEVFDDLMAITDAAVRRADVDETRVGAMGGSFGGYMANWIAGHTDRFGAIVSHAGLWALDQFGTTTDDAWYWRRELSPEMEVANSPHLAVGQIRTPMLLVHGDKDHRVPVGEALRAWYELLASSGLATDDAGKTPHRFLYFPDENHWVLHPQHAKVWYQVVEAFLAQHVLGLAGEGAPTYPRTLA